MDLKNIDPKNVNVTVGGRFKLKELIGKGSFGQIYRGVVNGTDSEVAIKLEKRQTGSYFGLAKEARIISDLNGKLGFPSLYAFGKEENFDYMAISLLGANLEKCLKMCGNRFPMKTTLMLADQILTRIEALHAIGYIHRDIKPENFLMGVGPTEKNLFLIDFGLAHMYLDSQGKHVPMKEKKGLVGTARYASVNSHAGYELSRRDDLESIGYMLIYFVKGKLPWQNIKAATGQEKYEKIAEIKSKTPIDTLCKDLPKEFAAYLTAVRALGYQETPNYKGLRKIFRMLFLESGFDYDFNYGWDKTTQKPSGSKKAKTGKFKLDSTSTKKEGVRTKDRVATFAKPNKYLAVFTQMDEVEEEKIEESYANPEKPESVSKETIQANPEDHSAKQPHRSSKNSSQKLSTRFKIHEDSESSNNTSKDLNISVHNKNYKNDADEEIPMEIDTYASPSQKFAANFPKRRGVTMSPKSNGLFSLPAKQKSNQKLEALRSQTSIGVSQRVIIDENSVKKEILERSKTAKTNTNHDALSHEG